MSIFTRKAKRAKAVFVKIEKGHLSMLDELYPNTKTDIQKVRDCIVDFYHYKMGLMRVQKSIKDGKVKFLKSDKGSTIKKKK